MQGLLEGSDEGVIILLPEGNIECSGNGDNWKKGEKKKEKRCNFLHLSLSSIRSFDVNWLKHKNEIERIVVVGLYLIPNDRPREKSNAVIVT